ncbi:unnamed protein product [Angiostrongylus costaricensis]|uniref:UBX domain-containing protein n=1 Tax=Angiostrongylus costaricensis TaxID=334426 RepID=A0A0R3PNR1_ANGCS|nr:unnamed protein product [Angiostrongylus costaricensis]
MGGGGGGVAMVAQEAVGQPAVLLRCRNNNNSNNDNDMREDTPSGNDEPPAQSDSAKQSQSLDGHTRYTVRLISPYFQLITPSSFALVQEEGRPRVSNLNGDVSEVKLRM